MGHAALGRGTVALTGTVAGRVYGEKEKVVKKKRTKAGLLQMLERASLRLDPTQKALAVKSMKEFIHAISVKDQKAAERAVECLARVFLRMSPLDGGDE